MAPAAREGVPHWAMAPLASLPQLPSWSELISTAATNKRFY